MATLTCAALTAAYFLQKDKWADSALNADYKAEVNATKAIVENQTAKIEYVTNAEKKVSARIYWSKFCDSDVNTTEPDFCDIAGVEADAECKDYSIDSHVNKSFTIDEAKYETSNLNISDVFADNMLKTKKAMDEKITQVLIAKLASFTSPNLYTTTGVGCPGVVGPPAEWDTTFIEPTKWTPELMNYFQTVARINKFSSPFLLDGKNLNATIWKAMMNSGNADGSGANKMVSLMKYYEDLVNVEAVSPGKTFMIDRGALAFVSRSRWAKYNATNPIEEKMRRKYSEKSDNIPGLVYDVYVTEECSGAYSKYNTLLHSNFELCNGPANCNGGSGLLEFECGPCPTV